MLAPLMDGRKRLAVTSLFAILLLIGSSHAYSQTLTWSDEFNSGTSLNTAVWSYEVGWGTNGWGNMELQCYQSGTANATVGGGVLQIQARQQRCKAQGYTSARVKTQGKKTFQYGRVEARLAGPTAGGSKGLWPAFWMLGANIASVPWPACGEIDIMEHINNDALVYGTIHYSNSGGAYTYYTPSAPAVAGFDTFHTYAVDWNASSITWVVDGANTGTASLLAGMEEFQQPYFVILNLAVGGNWPGSPDATTVFPANYKLDYVRHYQ